MTPPAGGGEKTPAAETGSVFAWIDTTPRGNVFPSPGNAGSSTIRGKLYLTNQMNDNVTTRITIPTYQQEATAL